MTDWNLWFSYRALEAAALGLWRCVLQHSIVPSSPCDLDQITFLFWASDSAPAKGEHWTSSLLRCLAF